MKRNIGIFLHFDFTLEGLLNNELKCYNEIFSDPSIDKIYIFDYKGRYSKMCADFTFEYTRVIISNFSDVEKFNKVDIILTWDGYQDFFAGTVSNKALDVYKILTTCSNDLNKQIIFRICDVKHYMKDYKEMIQTRLDTAKNDKFETANSRNVHDLEKFPTMNYENVYFLCNGSRTISDWSHVTLTKSMPFLKPEYVQEHTIYLSDDVLFRYEEAYRRMAFLEGYNSRIQKLYHIGNLNSGKVKMIKSSMKKSEVSLVLRTVQKGLNNSLKPISSIELIETPLYGDLVYEEINRYQAYLFVGKGDDHSCYFNKTMYDASISRTVFLIYSKIDKNNIYHELSDYIFNDEKQLKEKFEMLNENYEKHLRIQREVLIKNFSKENLFSKINKDKMKVLENV